MDIRTTRDHFDTALRAQIIYHLKEGQRLPVPLVTLSSLACLVLLVERNPRADRPVPVLSQDSLDRNGLLRELLLLGLPDNGQFQTEIQKLVECQAIRMGPDGCLYPLTPAFEQVALLERLFPTAPSLSLLAYAIQSIEEVRSGRKELQAALRHFIQTLTPGDRPFRPTAPARQAGSTTPAEASSRKLADLRRLAMLRRPKMAPSMTSKVWGRGSDGKTAQIREVFPKGTASTRQATVPSDQNSLSDANGPSSKAFDPIDPPAQIDEPPKGREKEQAATQAPADDATPKKQDAGEVFAAQDRVPKALYELEAAQVPEPAITPISLESAPLTSVPPQGNEVEPASESSHSTEQNATLPPSALEDESAIARQVEAFQADLSLVCPVCVNGTVITETTQKGRSYYACANSHCHFISWGKPYHFGCPDCNNSFLVEYADSHGRLGLACPRATCSYRQRGTDRPQRHKTYGRPAPSGPAATDTAAARPASKRMVRKRVLVRRR